MALDLRLKLSSLSMISQREGLEILQSNVQWSAVKAVMVGEAHCILEWEENLGNNRSSIKTYKSYCFHSYDQSNCLVKLPCLIVICARACYLVIFTETGN